MISVLSQEYAQKRYGEEKRQEGWEGGRTAARAEYCKRETGRTPSLIRATGIQRPRVGRPIREEGAPPTFFHVDGAPLFTRTGVMYGMF